MRTLPAALAERLASGVTTLAHVWRLVRRDGETMGFTDHDRPLVVDGLACAPASGVEIGAIQKSVGLSVDSASFKGALSSDGISEGDLLNGLWDSARVDLYVVDWSSPDLRTHLFAGRIGEVRRGVAGFEAEVRGLQAPLNAPTGRVFSRTCDADFGDARCGMDKNASAFRGEGVVAEVIGPSAFVATGLAAFSDGWFERGALVWSTGARSEVAAHRSDGRIDLLSAPGIAIEPGAAFVVHAGCDKKFDTCREKFANSISFRGFPHMPGTDAVVSGPPSGQVMDGGSRFR